MPDSTETIRIDADRALQLLREVVAEHGPDTVYVKPEGSAQCVYVQGGSCSCLVAHVLRRAGLTVDEIADFDVQSMDRPVTIEEAEFPERVHITVGALLVLADAQQEQDRGQSWSLALAVAEQAVTS